MTVNFETRFTDNMFYSPSVTEHIESAQRAVTSLVGELATERSIWVNRVLAKNVPKWKFDTVAWLDDHKMRWFIPVARKLIRADVEIISETLIADFGTRVVILLNGKYLADRKFKGKI